MKNTGNNNSFNNNRSDNNALAKSNKAMTLQRLPCRKLENSKFQNILYISTVFHVILIIVFYLGMPTFFEPLTDPQQPVIFEMLPASSINNVKTLQEKEKNKVKKETTKIKPSKKIDQQKVIKPQQKDKPVQKTKTVKTEPKPKPKLKPETKPKPKLKPKSKPKKIIKKIPAKKQQKPKKSKKLLKNLEKKSTGKSVKAPFKVYEINELDDEKFSKGQIYDENSPLSVTERLIIKRQIEQNWTPPIGAENLENIQILLHITLNKDGSVNSLSTKSIICPNNIRSTCILVVNSAYRAVMKANPLVNLRPDRYDTWKEFNLYFDPSNIVK